MTKKQNIFILVAFVQLLFLIYPAYLWYNIYNNGSEYKFRIDFYVPRETFHGNYLSLNFSDNKISTSEKFNFNQILYACLATDTEGFTKITKITTVPPKEQAYFQAQLASLNNNELRLAIPFNKYYLNEQTASKLLTLKQTKNNLKDSYVIVALNNEGRGIIKQIVINNKEIEGNF